MSHSGKTGAFIALLGIALLLGSCSKREEVQTHSDYSFTNRVNGPVKLEFYETLDDYYQRMKVFKTLTIPQDSTAVIEFEALKTYWLDWYTPDYLMSNWSSGLSQQFTGSYPLRQIAIANTDDNFVISGRYQDLSRWVLLNGNELSSTWRVDYDELPFDAGRHEFLFRRDFTGQYTYAPKGSAPQVTLVTFSFNQLGPYNFRMFVNDDHDTRIAELFFNSNPLMYPNFGKDTIMVAFRKFHSADFYPARRQ